MTLRLVSKRVERGQRLAQQAILRAKFDDRYACDQLDIHLPGRAAFTFIGLLCAVIPPMKGKFVLTFTLLSLTAGSRIVTPVGDQTSINEKWSDCVVHEDNALAPAKSMISWQFGVPQREDHQE